MWINEHALETMRIEDGLDGNREAKPNSYINTSSCFGGNHDTNSTHTSVHPSIRPSAHTSTHVFLSFFFHSTLILIGFGRSCTMMAQTNL